jgi:16S rRNA (guanine966-N2)-methyltransferase
MRISGGTARGRRLKGLARRAIRPTAGRVKAALFSILSDRIQGSRFLDLYAGTGAIGIEALSRGARHATFVEADSAASRLLEANLRCCGYEHLSKLRVTGAADFLQHPPEEPYDIVFLDPPYHKPDGKRLLPLVSRGGMIARDGVVIIEHFHKVQLPRLIDSLVLLKSYRYGDTLLSVYRFEPSEDPS